MSKQSEIPPYLQKPKAPQYKFNWSKLPSWQGAVTTEDAKKASAKAKSQESKKPPKKIEEDDVPIFVADRLDAKDGYKEVEVDGEIVRKGDGRIDAKYWNEFAELAGVPKLPAMQTYITTKEAAKIVKELQGYNNSNRLINAVYDAKLSKRNSDIAREYGNKVAYGTDNPDIKNTNKKDNMPWYKRMAFSVASFFVGGEGEKLLDDPDKYTYENNHTVSQVRGAVKQVAQKASPLPLSKRLLNLSVDDKNMYLRRSYYDNGDARTGKKIYTVLDEEQYIETTEKINMPAIGQKGTKLKTVLFEKDTKESKIISKDSGIKYHAMRWIYDNMPKDECYGAQLNGSTDTHWAINRCIVGGMTCRQTALGYVVKGYIEDIYDFADQGDESYSGITEKLNHMGYKAQEKGAIEPYRVLIPFEINIYNEEYDFAKERFKEFDEIASMFKEHKK